MSTWFRRRNVEASSNNPMRYVADELTSAGSQAMRRLAVMTVLVFLLFRSDLGIPSPKGAPTYPKTAPQKKAEEASTIRRDTGKDHGNDF